MIPLQDSVEYWRGVAEASHSAFLVVSEGRDRCERRMMRALDVVAVARKLISGEAQAMRALADAIHYFDGSLT